jgi:hypothetical protein
MLESLGTNPAWLGVATVSAIISLIYVFGQLAWFLWKRRGVLVAGVNGYRAARLQADLKDLRAAAQDRNNGYTDLAIAMIARRKVMRSFTGMAIGFMFLIVTSVAATMVADKALIVASVASVVGNVFFDIIRFVGSVYHACWLVRASYQPAATIESLEKRVQDLEGKK